MASHCTENGKHSTDCIKNECTVTSQSYFQKTVCLKDWWLVKAENEFEGKRLAVAGSTSRDKQAVRVFSSAPILKRYDVFNLETVDGVCVIIEGFMNKARTEENGFSSEVCNHFVFGFPPYWEIYSRKCLDGESTLMSDVQSNRDLESLSPHAERIGGSGKGIAKNFGKACNKKNSGVKSSSRGGKKGTKCNPNDKEAETAFDSNAYPLGPDASERETSSSVENSKNLEMSGSHFDDIIAEPLRATGLEKTSVASSIKTHANNTETENYGGRKCKFKSLEDHHKKSPLSALTKGRRCDTILQSLKDPSKGNSSKKLTERVVFSREADLSEELSDHCEERGIIYTEKKVKIKFADNPPGTSYQDHTDEMTSRNLDAWSVEDNVELDHGISLTGKDVEENEYHEGVQENVKTQNRTEKRNKKITSSNQSNSQSEGLASRKSRRKFGFNAVGNVGTSLDDRSGGKSILTSPGTQFQESINEMTLRNSDARPFEDPFERDHGIALTGKNGKEDQNHEGVQPNVRMPSSDAHGDIDKRKKKFGSRKQNNSQSKSLSPRKSRSKQSNSQRESLSSRNSRRKSQSPVSQKGNGESSVVSPQSLNLKRSRAGRWLLPSLEFWRNQRVFYDADHQIKGIKDLQ